MRAILTNESTAVYAAPDDQTISIATLHLDEEFEIGRVMRKKRQTWVEVTLDSGVKGYIKGVEHIFALRKVQLVDSSAEMRSEASAASNLIRTLSKGDAFFTLRVVKTDEGGWVRVRDLNNTEGYISGKTKIRVVQAATRADARKMLILGAIMAVIGILFGVGSYLSQAANNTIYYYLAIGFIVFGVMQLMQGFIQHRQAVAQEKQEQEEKSLHRPD
jgi:uncharacterized protein YgiM (DUF1202 family)